MSKKSILYIVIVVILSLLSCLGYNIITKAKEKNQIVKKLQTIPKFEFLTLKQQPFAKTNLRPNLNTIFVYFNSECDFCQHEAQSISDNLDSFKNVQFIFVSIEQKETIKKFAELYNINNHENIVFLEDKKREFSTLFNANSIPYILIYNQENKLIKKHKGQLNAKGILRALQEND